VDSTSAVPAASEEKRRRAVRGAFFGFFVDMFDIYLPVVVLTPAIKYFVSPDLSDGATALVTGMIFASTLVGRPVGALVFGHYADRIGRKRATLVSVSGFGVLTLVIGCLPGYSSWGMASVVLFIALRFVVGFFVGGEYTAASPLAMEYSAKEDRGRNSARIMLGFPLAYLSISALTLLVLQFAPSGEPDSAYSVWGWRIPFFVGGFLALAFVWYFARQVEESEVFEEVAGESDEAPIKQLLGRDTIGHFAQVFVLMTGFWLSLNTVTAILPGVLKDTIGLSATDASFTLMVAAIVNAGGYLTVGHLAQRFGRRPFLIAWGVSAAVLGTFVYWALLHFQPSSLVAVILLASATVVLVNPCWAMITAYINERFHTGMRASGFGLGYSLAVVIPAFYAFYQEQLSHVMSATYTVLPLLVIGGLLITLGGALGPETRDVDLGGDVRDTSPATSTGRFTRDGAPATAEPATVAMSTEERVR
jgi:MFS family permease